MVKKFFWKALKKYFIANYRDIDYLRLDESEAESYLNFCFNTIFAKQKFYDFIKLNPIDCCDCLPHTLENATLPIGLQKSIRLEARVHLCELDGDICLDDILRILFDACVLADGQNGFVKFKNCTNHNHCGVEVFQGYYQWRYTSVARQVRRYLSELVFDTEYMYNWRAIKSIISVQYIH